MILFWERRKILHVKRDEGKADYEFDTDDKQHPLVNVSKKIVI